ncbi:hypothetical protein [Xanthomonas arboricola]|uniref:hypothetical protein n=1 Tax=Xanthomonas arboricola TaxID=56448 RepID=UPI0011B0AB0D|nr:hypothetical protein [Xanthomonas arboricola]
MDSEARRSYQYWDSYADASDQYGESHLECFETRTAYPAPRPIQVYSRRAKYIQKIREHARWAAAHEDDDLCAPTAAAQSSAISVIQQLPEGCLDFRLGLSHSGEINLFFGQGNSPFQMLIDEDGLLSYFGRFGDERFAGSDIAPDEFPYMRLLCLLAVE